MDGPPSILENFQQLEAMDSSASRCPGAAGTAIETAQPEQAGGWGWIDGFEEVSGCLGLTVGVDIGHHRGRRLFQRLPERIYPNISRVKSKRLATRGCENHVQCAIGCSLGERAPEEGAAPLLVLLSVPTLP